MPPAQRDETIASLVDFRADQTVALRGGRRQEAYDVVNTLKFNDTEVRSLDFCFIRI